MTQEDKELLLKDLCARLPYGVMVGYSTKDNPNTLDKIGEIIYVDIRFGMIQMQVESGISYGLPPSEFIKPYLRPISSMTEEEMDMLFDILHIDKDGKDDDWIKINDVYGIKFFFPTGRWVENVAEAYDYLYSIHIDFRGLIPKGLAIEVNESNNPYKKIKL